jgi:hypothetical protein
MNENEKQSTGQDQRKFEQNKLSNNQICVFTVYCIEDSKRKISINKQKKIFSISEENFSIVHFLIPFFMIPHEFQTQVES